MVVCVAEDAESSILTVSTFVIFSVGFGQRIDALEDVMERSRANGEWALNQGFVKVVRQGT